MNVLLVTTFLRSGGGFDPGSPWLSLWFNILTTAIGIVGPPSLVSLIANRFSKPKKRLSYRTESDAALVDQRKDLGEDMTVTLKGGTLSEPTQVGDARLIMFRLVNTGVRYYT